MRNDVEEIPQNVLLMAEYAYNSVPLYMELRDELLDSLILDNTYIKLEDLYAVKNTLFIDILC